LEELHENSGQLSQEKSHLENEYQEVIAKKMQVEEVYQQSVENLQSLRSEKDHLEYEKNAQIAENHELKEQLNQKTEEYATLETKFNETLESKTNDIEALQHQMQEQEEQFKVSNCEISPSRHQFAFPSKAHQTLIKFHIKPEKLSTDINNFTFSSN